MTRYNYRLLISMGAFLFLIMFGALQIILGFFLIGLAETTTIEMMNALDWVVVLTGSIFIFSTFITIQLMKKVRYI